jgi:two-component system nitrogen regulation response regulator GlnG
MPSGHILVADDDAGIRTVLNQALTRAGYEVRATNTVAGLWRWVAAGEGDLVITDVVMPDDNAFDLLPRIKRMRPDLPIIVMSAQNTFMTAIKASERGAYEYLPKPFDLHELVAIVGRALAQPKGREAASEPPPMADAMPIVGRSPAMQDIFRVLARLMQTDLTVMISGESGTGKELVARALHDYGKRKNGPFVAINMAAIPRDLIESELFGHEKGAFTGAAARSVGRFEQAESGTLFLDEIGDMPMEAQTRLLRVLQQGEYTTVGGRTPLKSNVRIIAATNKDLRFAIQQGSFREDLFFRLNVVPIRLPPLRERSEDIPDLVRVFFQRGVSEGLPLKTIEPPAMERLRRYPWPGNVRELENLTRRLAALYPQEVVGEGLIETELNAGAAPALAPAVGGEGRGRSVAAAVGQIAGDEFAASAERAISELFRSFGASIPQVGLYHRVLHDLEAPLIAATLTLTRGNQIKAAQILGLNRNTLRKKIRDLSLRSISSFR